VGGVYFLGAAGNDLLGAGGVAVPNGLDDVIDALADALNAT
jgi:hypothetical protein